MRQLFLPLGAIVVFASLIIFGAALSAHAQNVTTTQNGDVLTSSTALLYAVGSAVGAIGALLVTLGPWIAKLDKKRGAQIVQTGNDLIKGSFYFNTLADKIKKHEANLRIMKDVLLSMANTTPEQRKAIADMEVRIAEAEEEITRETKRYEDEIRRFASQIPHSGSIEELKKDETTV